MNLNASSSKGQMKIQEMAFVLVAIMVFFGIVLLFYLSVRVNSLRTDVESLAQDEAKQLVRKLASSPELAFTVRNCPNCIDMDKAMALKSIPAYRSFWNIDYLKIEKVYPADKGECTSANYPNCNSITILDKEAFGAPPYAYVALCRQAFESEERYPKCEIGRIYASVEVPQ